MRVVIDRFEEGADGGGASRVAVLEDFSGDTFSVPADWLPRRAREGDVLQVRIGRGEEEEEESSEGSKGGSAGGDSARIELRLDPAATRARLEENRALRDRLPRAGKGDIEL